MLKSNIKKAVVLLYMSSLNNTCIEMVIKTDGEYIDKLYVYLDIIVHVTRRRKGRGDYE